MAVKSACNWLVAALILFQIVKEAGECYDCTSLLSWCHAIHGHAGTGML